MRLSNLRKFARTPMPEETSQPVPKPPEKLDPRTRAIMAQDALNGLQGDTLANVVYAILADHDGLSSAQLHSLANRLSRAADEKDRGRGS